MRPSLHMENLGKRKWGENRKTRLEGENTKCRELLVPKKFFFAAKDY
jgi:hypothetical protein